MAVYVFGISIVGILFIAAILLVTRNKHNPVVATKTGTTYFVSPAGNDAQNGTANTQPLKTIQKALALAHPGDKVQLADGAYYQSIKTVRAGSKGASITITGSQNAVLYGSSSRVIEINHSYITLDGFRVDGHFGTNDTKADYRDKLIYAIGVQAKKGFIGVKLTHLTIENAGGECVRMRYFAQENQISHNTIRNCGIWDFRFHDGGKNGEGIYIGTAPEQRKDGKNPTADVDESRDNHIFENTIQTNGNECVDIKEGATDNLIEHNDCSGQMDPESGGFDSRGEHNTFRNNTVHDTIGAAVRLGGDEERDGTDNNVYSNTFRNNKGGTLRIMRLPQGDICGNHVYGNSSNGKTQGINPTAKCAN
ncbi:MAG TPA: right-handed parallel beta-helix repeat-containing protein [Nevskiaceae bacterium]|nr:right-handed parallel beta-helix repeat-containing protein [Nevskiaceae bacterium]